MRWYLAKIQSCTIVLLNNFEILRNGIVFFSDTVRPRNLKFFLYNNPYGYSMQTKFHVPRSHSFGGKMRWYLAKIQSCKIVLINNFEILQHSIAFFSNAMITWKIITLFSNTVRPSSLKFFLCINPYEYSLQTKFHVLRSYSFREKCNDNL